MKNFKINKKAVYKILDGKVHILDYRTATIHTLNETASFIWNLLVKKISKKDLLTQILNEFDIEHSQAKIDLDEFLQEYLDKEFIITENDKKN